MLPAHLKVGDRVKARTTIGRLQAGTRGTVRLVFNFIPGAYDVQFDDYPSAWMMQRDELERIEDVARAAGQDAPRTV